VVVTYVGWRWTSVERGARKRDQKLVARLDPLGRKLDAGEPVSTQEIASLAAHSEIRYFLFTALRRMNRADLLPTNYCSTVAQGESALAYWMMHPNEMGEPPEAIEFVESVRRRTDGKEAEFYVYRYRMAAGHPDAEDGWQLGLAGPMNPEGEPYTDMPAAFCRGGDIYGKVKPSELVDWYLDMLRKKGIIK
jgi:hypothetical protein